MTTPETHTTPAEACRMIAIEVRSVHTSALETLCAAANQLEVASVTDSATPEIIRTIAASLRDTIRFTTECSTAIASALDDLAADLDTPREQLLVNLSAAVELLTPAEDARIRALATVQALHSEGRISDEAAAALNQALETPDAVEGT